MKKGKKIVFVIIFIAIISFFVIPYSFAVYRKSSSTYGNITSATWDVFLTQNGIPDHLSVVAGTNGTTANYTLNITNSSQVDVIYSILITGLSRDVSVSIDGGNTFTKENNGQITFSDVGTISYVNGGNSVAKTLTFKALSTAEFVNNNAVDIKVVVRQAL